MQFNECSIASTNINHIIINIHDHSYKYSALFDIAVQYNLSTHNFQLCNYTTSKMNFFTKTLLVFQLFVYGTRGQKLCNFSDSVKTNTSSFIQNFSTNKCMQVSAFGFLPASKVIINECTYWNKATTDQKFTLVPSPLNKFVLKTDAGNKESFCLTTTKKGILQSDVCQSSNFDQNWSFKPISGKKGLFLIEQYSSKGCVIPMSRSTESSITLAPCNAYQTEQIWKVCY